MKDEEYFINHIKIDDWLYDDVTNKKSKIRFRDRTEHYLGKDLHNEHDYAIVYNDMLKQNDNKHYLYGKYYDNKQEWLKDAKKLARKDKLETIFKDDNLQNE